MSAFLHVVFAHRHMSQHCSDVLLNFFLEVSKKSVLTQTGSIWELRTRNYLPFARNFDV